MQVLLALVAIGGVVDLILDRPTTLWNAHVLFELAFVTLCLVGLAAGWSGWRRARHSLGRTQAELTRHATERDHWRARAETLLRGLSAEIDAQLDRWVLSPAEKETALLLLKGCGHKEIANVLGKSERTVRQQAIAVYRKSGLAGRAELSAFFLEDLLLPAMSGSADATPNRVAAVPASRSETASGLDA